MNPDLIKFYNVLKEGYPDIVADMTPEEFVARVGDRGKFIDFLDVLPQVDPDVFKTINKQEVLDRVYPIRKNPNQGVVKPKPTPVLEQSVLESDAFNLVPTIEDAEDNSLFGQLGRTADSKSKEAEELISKERTQQSIDNFDQLPVKVRNLAPQPYQLPEKERQELNAKTRFQEAIEAGLQADQVTPKELFQFVYPDESSDAYNNLNILERDLGKGLDEEGKMNPYSVIGGFGAAIQGVRYTPEEIMAMKEGDLPNLDKKQWQKIKEYVGAHKVAEAAQKRKELELYNQFLATSQEKHIPREVFNASDVIEALAPKYESGEITEEEMATLQTASQVLQNLPDETKAHLQSIPKGASRVEQEIQDIDVNYPEVKIVEKLNQEIQRSYDDWYNSIGRGLSGNPATNILAPVALKSLLNVAKAGVEVLPTLGNDLLSTYDAVSGGFFGDEDAQANTIRRANSFVQSGTLIDASQQKRSIFEKTAKVNIKGIPHEIGFDEKGNVTNVYDQYGSVVNMSQEDMEIIQGHAPAYYGEATTKFNNSAAFNAVTDGVRDLAVTMILSKGVGQAVKGAGGLAQRVREGIPIMFQYTGKMAQEGINQGLSPDEALLYAGMQVGMESGTEMMFPFIGKLTGAGFNTKRALDRLISNPETLKQLSKKEFFDLAIKGPLGEGVEEATAAFLNPVVNQAFNELSDENLDTTAADWQEIGTSAALGLVIGALPGLVGGISRSKAVPSDSYLAQTIFAATDKENIQKATDLAKSFKTPEYDRMAQILQTTHDETKDIREAEGSETDKIKAVVAKFNEVKRRYDAVDSSGTVSSNKINQEADDLHQTYTEAANAVINPAVDTQPTGTDESTTEGVQTENLKEFPTDTEAEGEAVVQESSQESTSGTETGDNVNQKKADIEKRRQEELDKRIPERAEIWEDENGDYYQISYFKDGRNNIAVVDNVKGDNPVISDRNIEPEGYLPGFKKVSDSPVRGNIEKFTSKINAKYDAELAALGEPINPTDSAQSEDIANRKSQIEDSKKIDSLQKVPETGTERKESILPEAPSDELSTEPLPPIKVYHGTFVESLDTDSDGITWFTDNPKTADQYRRRSIVSNEADFDGYDDSDEIIESESGINVVAEEQGIDINKGNVFAGNLQLKNPLDLRGFGLHVDDIEVLWEQLNEAGLVNEKWEEIDEEFQEEMRDNYEGKALWKLLEGENIYDEAQRKGFDGVVIEDVGIDGKTHVSFGAFGLKSFTQDEGQKTNSTPQQVTPSVEGVQSPQNSETTKDSSGTAEPVSSVLSTTRTVTPVKKADLKPKDIVEIEGQDWKVEEVRKDGIKVSRRTGNGQSLAFDLVQPEDITGKVTNEVTNQDANQDTNQAVTNTVEKVVENPQKQRTTLASLTQTLQDVFKLPKAKADAAARIADRIITTISERTGKSKQEIYDTISFEIPSQEVYDDLLKQARGSNNNPQEVNGEVRGALVTQDAQYIIYALTNPNVSTPLHELAHVFERYLTQEEIDAIISAAKTTAYVNGKTVPAWTNQTSEYFAKGFEQYLRSGIAPSPELKTLFEKFKTWLTEIYKSVHDLNGLTLSPQVTEIYKKMLGVSDPKLLTQEEKKVDDFLGDIGIQFQSGNKPKVTPLPNSIEVANGIRLVKNENNSAEFVGGIVSTNYDVIGSGGQKIGNVHIHHKADGYLLSNIRLDTERTGLGTNIYKTLMATLSKPLLSGEVTNEKSKGLWEKLVKEGLATRTGEGYRGKLLAPNGKPSNLSPGQWRQVRTPEFKAYFGDFLSEEQLTQISDPNGANVFINNFLPTQDSAILSLPLVQRLVLSFSQNDEILRAVIRLLPVDVVNGLVGYKLPTNISSSDLSVFKAALYRPISNENISVLEEVLARLTTELSSFFNTGSNQVGISALDANNLSLSEVGRFLAFKGISDFGGGNRGIVPTSTLQGTESTLQVGLGGENFSTKFARLVNSYLTSPHRPNIQKVSHVRDENGEPLVVYHGSDVLNTFSEFEKGDIGFHFGQTKEQAEDRLSKSNNLKANEQGLLHDERPDGIGSFFLNIKNPVTLPDVEFWTPANLLKMFKEAEPSATWNYNQTVPENIQRILAEIGDKVSLPDGIKYHNRYEGRTSSKDNKAYIVFQPNQIKSATDNSGAFNPNDNRIQFQIVGEQGAKNLDKGEEATHRLDNLEVARAMEKAGEGVVAIRVATGWERGADGLWRYEIPDIISADKGKLTYSSTEVTTHRFGDVINAPWLFNAYPQLKDYTFTVLPDRLNFDRIDGQFDPDTDDITILASIIDTQKGYSALLHEIQHAIQHIEGFDTGSSMEKGASMAIAAANGLTHQEYLEKLYELRNAIETAKVSTVPKEYTFEKSQFREDRFAPWKVKHPDNVGVIARARTKKEAQQKALEFENNKRTRRLREEYRIFTTTTESEAKKFYNNKGGEVEARNVETRVGFTDDQRRLMPLFNTEDVSREDQVFLERNLGDEETQRLGDNEGRDDSVQLGEGSEGINGRTLFEGDRSSSERPEGYRRMDDPSRQEEGLVQDSRLLGLSEQGFNPRTEGEITREYGEVDEATLGEEVQFQTVPNNPKPTKKEVLGKISAARDKAKGLTGEMIFSRQPDYFRELGISAEEIQKALDGKNDKPKKRWANVPKEVIDAIKASGTKLSRVSGGWIKVFEDPNLNTSIKIMLFSGHDIKKKGLTKDSIAKLARSYVPVLTGSNQSQIEGYRLIADQFLSDDSLQQTPEYYAWQNQAALYLKIAFDKLGDVEYLSKIYAKQTERNSIAATQLGAAAEHMLTGKDLLDHRLLELRQEAFGKLYIPTPQGTTPAQELEVALADSELTESEVQKLWNKIKDTKFGKELLSRMSTAPIKITKANKPKQQKGIDSLDRANSLLSQAFAAGRRNVQFQGAVDPLEEGLKELAKAAMYFANGDTRVARDYFTVQLDGRLGDAKYTDELFDTIHRSSKFATMLQDVRRDLALEKANQKQESLLTKKRLDPVDSFIQELIWAGNKYENVTIGLHAPQNTTNYTQEAHDLYNDYKAQADEVAEKLSRAEITVTEANRQLHEISENLQNEFDEKDMPFHTPKFEVNFNQRATTGDKVRIGTDVYKFTAAEDPNDPGKWENTKTGRLAIGDRRNQVEDEFRKRSITKSTPKVDLTSLTREQIEEAYNNFKQRFSFEGKKLADKLNPAEEFVYNLYGIDLTGKAQDRVFNKEVGNLLSEEQGRQLHAAIADKADSRPLAEKVATITGLPIEDATRVANAFQDAFDTDLADEKRKVLSKYAKSNKTLDKALKVIKSGTGDAIDFMMAFGDDYNFDSMSAAESEKFRDLVDKYKNAKLGIDKQKALDDIGTFLIQNKKENWAVKAFNFIVELHYGAMLNGITTLFAPLVGSSFVFIDSVTDAVHVMYSSIMAGKPIKGAEVLWNAFVRGFEGIVKVGAPEMFKILITGDSSITPFDQDVRLGHAGWWYKLAVQNYKDAITKSGAFRDSGLPARIGAMVASLPIAVAYRTFKAPVYFDALVRGFATPYNQVLKFYYDAMANGDDFANFGARVSEAMGRGSQVKEILDQEVQDRGLSGAKELVYRTYRQRELWNEFADQELLERSDKLARRYAFMQEHVEGKLGYAINTINYMTTPSNFQGASAQVGSMAGTVLKGMFFPFLKMQGNFANAAMSFTPLNLVKYPVSALMRGASKIKLLSKYEANLKAAADWADPSTFSVGKLRGFTPQPYEGLDKNELDAQERWHSLFRGVAGTLGLLALIAKLFDFDEEKDELGNDVMSIKLKDYESEGSLLITGSGLSSYAETTSALNGWEPNSVLIKEGNKYRKIAAYDRHVFGVALAPIGWLTDAALLGHKNKNVYPTESYYLSMMLQVGKSQGLMLTNSLVESVYTLNNDMSTLLEIATAKQSSERKSQELNKAIKYMNDDWARRAGVAITGGNLVQQITTIQRALDGQPQLRGKNAWEDALVNTFWFDEMFDTETKINQFGSEVHKKPRIFADLDGLSEYVVKPPNPEKSELEQAVHSKPEIHFPGITMSDSVKDVVYGVPEAYTRDARDAAGKLNNQYFIWNRDLFDNAEAVDGKELTEVQEAELTSIKNKATQHAKVEMILKYYTDITGEVLPAEEFLTNPSKKFKNGEGTGLQSYSLEKLTAYFRKNDITIYEGKVGKQAFSHK